MWWQRIVWLRGKGTTSGFSIVEMMAVVVIIGILVQLGMTRYRVMIAKSRQAEARLNLNSIDSLQEGFYLEHGKRSTENGILGLDECETDDNLKNELGFRPADCKKLRYKYDWNASNSNATAKSGTGEGKRIFPGCTEGVDEWVLTYKNSNINNNKNVIKECQ